MQNICRLVYLSVAAWENLFSVALLKQYYD